MFLSTLLPWTLVAVLAATVLFLRSRSNHRFQAPEGSPFPLPWTQTSRNNETLRAAFWLACIAIIVLASIVAVLVQTRQEKEFVFVEFPKEGNHVVKIAAAGKDIQANEVLTAASLRTYVYERELIDGQTEGERYTRVRAKSAPSVWSDFEKVQRPLVTQHKGLKRQIVIHSDRKIANHVYDLKYTAIDTIEGKYDPVTGKPWESRTTFEVTITYSFKSQETSYEHRYDNPVGIYIEKWTRSKDE